MKKKERLILSVVILSIGTVFNLFFTAALHRLLSRKYNVLPLIPLWECVAGLFNYRQQFLLFLSFEGYIFLCSILFWVHNNRPYQSELVRVAEDIFTPAPVGQFQHGSARWLKDTEKMKVFGIQTINPQNELIKPANKKLSKKRRLLKGEKLQRKKAAVKRDLHQHETRQVLRARRRKKLSIQAGKILINTAIVDP